MAAGGFCEPSPPAALWPPPPGAARQQVYPSSAVSVAAVLVLANAPPDVGEERVDRWEDSLEALVAVG